MKLTVACVVILLAACACCERWKWRECRTVGHSWFYCLSEITEGK